MPVIRMAPVTSDRIVRIVVFLRPPSLAGTRRACAPCLARVLIRAPRRQGRVGRGRKRMPNDPTSPLATYLSHLEKGELAYQFSPAANRAVFFPRVLCPFTGSDKLEWRVSKGLGTVLRDDRRASGRRRAVQRRADRLRRRLPPDEPRRGHRARRREDRHAGELPRASPGRRGTTRSPCSPRRPRDGRPEARRAAIVGVAESDLGQVADGMSPIDLMAQGIAARARRLRADAEGRRRPVLRHDAERMSIVSLIEYLGIQPKFIGSIDDRRLVVRVSRRAGGGRDRRPACATSR